MENHERGKMMNQKSDRANDNRRLEASFDDYVNNLTHNWMKILILMAGILVPLFFILDCVIAPRTLLLRFGIYRGATSIIILIIYTILRMTRPSRFIHFYGYMLSLPVALMITIMTVDLGGFDSSYYAGLNLVIIAIGLYLPWRPRYTIINSVVVVGMYTIMNMLFGEAFKIANLINNLYFLTSTAVITIGISFVRYNNTRKEFNLRAQLAGAQVEEIRKLAEVAQVVSKGDLSIRVNKRSSDIAGILEAAFDVMVSDLREAMMKITNVSGTLASYAGEIKDSIDRIALGAGTQLERTNESSRIIKEMTEQIIASAKKAEETNRMSAEAIQTADRTRNDIDRASAGMERIASVVRQTAGRVTSLSSSSNRIREIVEVINEIADQTHLLALNAAIESARAGQFGRGFAVVSDEVGKLAEKTADATKEITTVIKNVIAEIDDTVRSIETADREVDTAIALVNRMHDSMRDIVAYSSSLSELMSAITRHSGEEAASAQQISKNIDTVAGIARELSNSLGVIRSGVDRIYALIQTLSEMVGKFKLE